MLKLFGYQERAIKRMHLIEKNQTSILTSAGGLEVELVSRAGVLADPTGPLPPAEVRLALRDPTGPL